MAKCNPCSSDKGYEAPIEFELMKKTTEARGRGQTVEKYAIVFSGYATVKQKTYYDNYNGGSNTQTRTSIDYILDTAYDERITTEKFLKINEVYYTISRVSDPNLNRTFMNLEIHRESKQENV